MDEIIGIDNRKRLRKLGVFSDAIEQPGGIVARAVMRDSDIIMVSQTSALLGLGTWNLFLGAFPADYIYNVQNLVMFYLGGAVSVGRLMTYRGANPYYIAMTNNFPVGVSVEYHGSFWQIAADSIIAQVTVTTANVTLYLFGMYTRHPYLADTTA